MPAYDSRWFDPPAPADRVVLRDPATGRTEQGILVLLDWGSDVSLIPAEAARKLQVQVIPDRQYELMGFDHSRSFAPVVHLELVFLERIFRGQFLLMEGKKSGESWGATF